MSVARTQNDPGNLRADPVGTAAAEPDGSRAVVAKLGRAKKVGIDQNHIRTDSAVFPKLRFSISKLRSFENDFRWAD